MARRFRAIAGARLAAKGRPGVSVPKLALTVGVTAVFCGLLWARLRGMEMAAVVAALARVTPLRWAGAVAATGISFWAVGRYDDAVHRHLATGVPAAQARRAGVCGIALSQLLGMGVVTGTLVRWRMLPSLSLLQAGRLTLAVSLLFLAGWALVTAGAVLALGGPFQPVAVLVLALWAAAMLLALRPPRRLRALPNVLTLGRVAGLAAVDCLAAGLGFWCLWPGAPDLAALLPGFLMALGAGLMSGTPGGLGAFELTLMAQLPDMAEAPLLAAVLAWRVVYFLVPATLALMALLRGPLAARR